MRSPNRARNICSIVDAGLTERVAPNPRMNKAQVHIESGNIANDQLLVRDIIVETRDRFKLFDNRETSRVPKTIISIVEREHYGFGLGARIVDKLIIVDFNRGKSPSPAFDDVYKFIAAKLFAAFPQNAKEANENEFIPPR